MTREFMRLINPEKYPLVDIWKVIGNSGQNSSSEARIALKWETHCTTLSNEDTAMDAMETTLW